MGELDNKRTFPQRFVSSMVVVVSRTSHYLSHGGGGGGFGGVGWGGGGGGGGEILGGIGAEGDQSSPMRTGEMNHKNIVLQSFMGGSGEILSLYKRNPPHPPHPSPFPSVFH